MLGPRQQGDLGEWSAMHWLAEHGYAVFIPIGHSPDVDMIALRDSEVLRVQVKTTGCFRGGRWEVAICTSGGNRSWTGLVKRFSSERCDRLFVLVGDGRRWFMPSAAVDGGNKIVLGGPKYAAYEVEPGRPFSAGGRASSLS